MSLKEEKVETLKPTSKRTIKTMAQQVALQCNYQCFLGEEMHISNSHPIRMDSETFSLLNFLPVPMLDSSKEHYRSFEKSTGIKTTETDRPNLNLKLATTK